MSSAIFDSMSYMWPGTCTRGLSANLAIELQPVNTRISEAYARSPATHPAMKFFQIPRKRACSPTANRLQKKLLLGSDRAQSYRPSPPSQRGQRGQRDRTRGRVPFLGATVRSPAADLAGRGWVGPVEARPETHGTARQIRGGQSALTAALRLPASLC